MRLIDADNYKGKIIASHCYSGVNNFIQNLKEKGTTEITLDITTTGKGIDYILIW